MQERAAPLDAETKVAERPHDHQDELRLWLRLFACKEVIEGEVRRRLRHSFDVTLPRFDLMAQLYRAPKAMTLGELSQRMMVSNGNVTGLVDRLVEQGLISRRPSPKDRRAQLVSLTAEGRRFFRAMARAYLAEHEDRPYAPTIRFDAIGVVIDARGRLVRLDHIEGAF